MAERAMSRASKPETNHFRLHLLLCRAANQSGFRDPSEPRMAERAMSRAGKAAKASHSPSPSPSHEGSYFPDPAQSGWQPESAPSGMPRILVRLLNSPLVTRWPAWHPLAYDLEIY